jgi:hypothetical protein
MLRHDHLDVQRAHHAGPIPQDLVRHHVAAVEGFHMGQGIGQLRKRAARLRTADE